MKLVLSRLGSNRTVLQTITDAEKLHNCKAVVASADVKQPITMFEIGEDNELVNQHEFSEICPELQLGIKGIDLFKSLVNEGMYAFMGETVLNLLMPENDYDRDVTSVLSVIGYQLYDNDNGE